MPTMLDSEHTHALPPGLALAWGVTPAPRRGPKPAHSVAQIVEAAMELADTEGFAAASMPNIAAALGVTTNALYRYVNSKEELVVLLADAGWGTPPAGLGGRADWRGTVRAWTHAAIERCRARPWLLDIPSHGPPLTPNLLRWMEILLQAMADAGLRGDDLLGCALLVHGFARDTAGRLRGPAEPPEQLDAVRSFLLPLLDQGGYARLAEALTAGQYLTEAGDTVDFGVDRLLDGITVLVGSSR
jgi:AcrR family transcriptional regulator